MAENYTPNLGETPAENARRDCVRYMPISDYPAYRVGDDGSVWSCLKRSGVPGKRNGGSCVVIGDKWKKLALQPNIHGYPCVWLYCDGKRRLMPVHKLVLESFVGLAPSGLEAAHENGCRSDNRLTNLTWKTHQANQQDQIRHGTIARGSRSGGAKLTEALALAIVSDFFNGETNKTHLGAKYSISRSTVRLILIGRLWSHTTGIQEKSHESAAVHA